MKFVTVHKTLQLTETIPLSFPYYISLHDSNTMFFVIKVNEDLSYVEIYKESPQNINYSIRFGNNFEFRDVHIQENQKNNYEFYCRCLEEVQKSTCLC